MRLFYTYLVVMTLEDGTPGRPDPRDPPAGGASGDAAKKKKSTFGKRDGYAFISLGNEENCNYGTGVQRKK